MLPHLLNADKCLLPIYWKQARIPSLEEWTRKVKEIKEAEEWVATCNGISKRFNTIWALWLHHTSDTGFIPSSLDTALLELAEPYLRGRKGQCSANP